MADQLLKDIHNRPIAVIKTNYNGQIEIYDIGYKRLGFYDPKSDQTFDNSNRVIGYGNLLTMLLN